MAPEKENKIWEAVKKQFIGISLGLIALVWTGVKELVSTGAEVKHKTMVVNIVVEDPTIKTYVEGLIDTKIQSTMNDAATWLAVLDNDFLSSYTEKKTAELRQFVNQKMAEVDSVQKAFYSQLGALSGDRDEKVLEVLGAMMREYKKKSINMVHVPTM